MLVGIIQHFVLMIYNAFALMIYKVFRFDDIHGIALIGFAYPLPLKDLAVFPPPRAPPRGRKTNRDVSG